MMVTSNDISKMEEAMGPLENHSIAFASSDGNVVRDIIIGFADGLTVPLGSTKLVITGGSAELFSGAISMGLGAYLAAVTERSHYISEEKRERDEIQTRPEDEEQEIYKIMEEYGIDRRTTRPLVVHLAKNPEQMVRFMMDFELELARPNTSRAWISAATMGASYFIGGLIPMIPYFEMRDVTHALFVSTGITVFILIVFGYIKNYVTMGTSRAGFYGSIQTLFIGVLAAAISYGTVRATDSRSPVNVTCGK